MEGSSSARVVVCEEASGEVGETLLDNGIGWIYPQGNTLDHAEGSQDECKV